MQRPPRAPQQPRSRKRWAAVAGIAALWVILSYGAGSVVAGTILLVLLAVAVVIIMIAMRSLGINRDHPWMQWLDARPRAGVSEPPSVPWRDVSEPAGYAGWRDVSSPAGPVPWRDVSEPAAPAGWPSPGGPAVPPGWGDARDPAALVGRPGPGPSSPPGPPGPPQPANSVLAHAREGGAYVNPAAARTVVSEFVTVAAQAQVPLLRLRTNGQLSETRTSGVRAGRSMEAELRLPEEPTVSRMHAEFTFIDGRWHVTNRGLNGVTLNGTALTGMHALRDGDSIGWGTQPGALVSRVEIGRDRAGQSSTPR
jgi:FHA domain